MIREHACALAQRFLSGNSTYSVVPLLAISLLVALHAQPALAQAPASIVEPKPAMLTLEPSIPQPSNPQPPVPHVETVIQTPPTPTPATAPLGAAPVAAIFDWSKFSIGGQYRILPNVSNFGFHSPTISDNQTTQALVLQRLRLWLTYNPTENVEGYIQMQVGQIPWGTGYDFNKTFVAGGTPLVGDNVGILLRRAWLAVKDNDLGKFRAGVLDWHDSFNDTLASADYDFNISGVEWTKEFAELDKLKLTAAALLLNDQAFVSPGLAPGAHSAFLFAWDADQPIGDKSSVGFSAYYLNDRGGYSYSNVGAYTSSWDVWLGVRGKLGLDPMPISGFFLANTGKRNNFGPTDFTHTGWAAQIQFGPMQIGPGKLSVQGLYASGGKGNTTGRSNEFRTVAQSYRDNYGAQGYWSYLQLTTPNGPGDVSDLGVGLQNRGLGLATAQAKYEYPITACLSGTSAAGWLRSATKNPLNGSANIGTEVLQMFTYNFGGGLKLESGAAVLFTGNFYRAGFNGPAPRDLFEGFARLQLEF